MIFVIPGRTELVGMMHERELARLVKEKAERSHVTEAFIEFVSSNAEKLTDGQMVILYWSSTTSTDYMEWLHKNLNYSYEYRVRSVIGTEGWINWEVELL